MPRPELPAWTRISSTLLLEHGRMTVAEDEVELPDGKRLRWVHTPRTSDFVTVIAVDDAQRVLVCYEYCYPPQRVVDEFPGGGINPGETVVDAGRRELLEETGWHARDVREIGAYLVSNRRASNRGRVVLATRLEAREAAPEDGEIIAWEWLAPDQVERAIASGDFENTNLLSAWAIYRAQGAPLDQST